MGCSTTREKIESKMLKLKLRRVEIKQERNKQIKELEKITGKHVNRQEIEDYVDELFTVDQNINNQSDFEKDRKIENETKKSNNSNKKRKKKYEKEYNDSSSDNNSENDSDSYKRKKKKRQTKKKTKKYDY